LVLFGFKGMAQEYFLFLRRVKLTIEYYLSNHFLRDLLELLFMTRIYKLRITLIGGNLKGLKYTGSPKYQQIGKIA